VVVAAVGGAAVFAASKMGKKEGSSKEEADSKGKKK